MDIIPNKYDALILRLTTISPLARHIMEREQYRLRLETDDVDSEPVLQECVIALRDDLAAIGLYLTCPLSDLYIDFHTLNEVIDTLEYIMPNTFYPKLKSDGTIKPMIQSILSGDIGDEPTILLFLRWLGSGPDCYESRCTPGAHWLSENMNNTELFNTYLANLITVETALDRTTPMYSEDLINYIRFVQKQISLRYATLERLEIFPEVKSCYARLKQRFDHYTKRLLQPHGAAEQAWLYTTDPNTLSDDLLAIFNRRWKEFRQSNKLYGDYYTDWNNVTNLSMVVIGIVIRLYAEDPDRSRSDYLQKLNEEIPTKDLPLAVMSLPIKIASVLYPSVIEKQ